MNPYKIIYYHEFQYEASRQLEIQNIGSCVTSDSINVWGQTISLQILNEILDWHQWNKHLSQTDNHF